MISYIGSKGGGMGTWIEQHIPRDIETYSEPFSGMFNVYFQMDLDEYKNLKNVIYNDFNSLNSNIFACVKQHEKFREHVNKQECQQKGEIPTPPKYKEMFLEYQKEIFDKHIDFSMEKPDFETGVQYAYVLSQVFSGSKPESAGFIDLKGKYNCKFESFRSKVNFTNRGKKLKKHFESITYIENMDFEDLMIKYDSPTTYYYLDPPYYQKEKYYSNHEFGLETHKRLADCIKKLKAKWSLSYYYFTDLEEWFPKDKYKWVEKEFNKISGAKKGKETSKSTEILIMNYEI